MGYLGNMRSAKAMSAMEEAIHVECGTRNPFGWVRDVPVLVLVPGISGPQLALSASDGQYVMQYFFDRDRGPMEQLLLGPTTDPRFAISQIRPQLRALSTRVRGGGNTSAADSIDQLVNSLTWYFGDTSEVLPRLEAVVKKFWGKGNWPDDPDEVSSYIREADEWGLIAQAAQLEVIAGFSAALKAHHPESPDDAWWLFSSARDHFARAMDRLDRAGKESSKLYGVARQAQDDVEGRLAALE